MRSDPICDKGMLKSKLILTLYHRYQTFYPWYKPTRPLELDHLMDFTN